MTVQFAPGQGIQFESRVGLVQSPIAAGGSETSIGTYLDTDAGNRGIGDLGGVPFGGFFFTASVTGTLRRVIWSVESGAAGNAHCELWSVSGNNPGSQIGSDSSTEALANGDNTFTWASEPSISSGTEYCIVIDVSETSAFGNFDVVSNNASFGSDRDTTAITSLDKTAGIDGFGEDWLVEVVQVG